MSTINISVKYLIKNLKVKGVSDLENVQARVTEAVTRAVALGAKLGADDCKEEESTGTLHPTPSVDAHQ